jgi:hypothetical protein
VLADATARGTGRVVEPLRHVEPGPAPASRIAAVVEVDVVVDIDRAWVRHHLGV